MATIRKSILGANTVLDAVGDSYFEPYNILATNDIFRHLILRMGANNAAAPTVKSGAYGAFLVPQDFASGATIYIYWTSTLTSGDAVFDFDYRAVGGNDSESLDQTTFQESVSVTDTAPSATNELMQASVSLTSSNLAAGDLVEFYFARDGTDAADTLAGSALVHHLVFEYTT
jgi:hypothetical protein